MCVYACKIHAIYIYVYIWNVLSLNKQFDEHAVIELKELIVLYQFVVIILKTFI